MKLRTGDFIAGAVVVILAVAIWIFASPRSQKGDRVTVSRDGKVIYELPLSEDRITELPECEVRIEHGRASITNSACPDKVCERSGSIKNSGEIIICVPNRISIEIPGEKGFDAIAS